MAAMWLQLGCLQLVKEPEIVHLGGLRPRGAGKLLKKAMDEDPHLFGGSPGPPGPPTPSSERSPTLNNYKDPSVLAVSLRGNAGGSLQII
jgi:hypothetical protein